MRQQRRKHHVWRWLGAIFLLLLAAAGGYGYYVYSSAHAAIDKTYTPLKAQTTSADKKITSAKPISILLMGTDTGSLGRTEKKGRTDTMILVTINPTTKKTTMTSIPRDTLSEMVGTSTTNVQKINAAYSIGGADMAVNSVSALLNVPIDYYVLVNMGALTKVVNAVGGVDVTVPFSFTQSGVSFTKGKMHLTGSQALQYVRMRDSDPEGDYGREKRQQQVITAILKNAASLSTLTNFKKLLTAIDTNLQTNLSFADMISLYQKYMGATKSITRSQLIGNAATIDAWYQVVSTEKLQATSDALRKELGLSTATLSNAETKMNAANTNFDWSSSATQYYQITGLN
ncbi:LCP family protein [Lacticaseibacillus mingshuiensis]|uniref:LCP family protein n=1 Tax=Lacticaseibacillus mingshuiensis TaxID=2799574 RepID=UPI001CEC606E|nr:LCP family protein [Lacticaseibacillus mingshuiensis]